MKRIKTALLVLAAAALVLAVALAFRTPPVAVDVAEVKRADLRVTLDEDGVARARARFVVSAPVAGKMARVEREPGDDVEAGATIARITPADPPPFDNATRAELEARVKGAEALAEQQRAAVERAVEAEAFARRELERVEALGLSGSIPRERVETARFEARLRARDRELAQHAATVAEYERDGVRAARARLRRAAQGAHAIGETWEVKSPIRGRLLRIERESEGVVAAGAPLFEVADPSSLEVVVDVVTADAPRIANGAKVLLANWGGDVALEGRVRRVDPSAFTKVSALGVEEQRVNVRIDLTSDREAMRALGDGFRVEAHIVVYEAESVVTVPSNALFRRGEGFAVFVVRDGRAELRDIAIGPRNGALAEVRSGLEVGERVILYPSDRVSDGVKVAPRP
jgi:HlyD family secretion protein